MKAQEDFISFVKKYSDNLAVNNQDVAKIAFRAIIDSEHFYAVDQYQPEVNVDGLSDLCVVGMRNNKGKTVFAVYRYTSDGYWTSEADQTNFEIFCWRYLDHRKIMLKWPE